MNLTSFKKLASFVTSTSIGKPVLVGLALSTALCVNPLTVTAAEIKTCDVISQATVKVLEIKTTTTQATIKWKEAHTNDSRYFCYGTTPQSSSCNTKVPDRSSHTTIMSGLTPNTKYYYIFYGVGHGKKTTTTGSVIADGSQCITSNSNLVLVKGAVLSATDSLEGVAIAVSKTAGGTVVARDTTSSAGQYSFALDPGNYFVSMTYPPYTSIAALPITIKSGTPLVVPTQKLSGAFQVAGTLIGVAKDTVAGATVTVVNTMDPTQTYTRTTDDEGYYSFGLKPGTYKLNAQSGAYKIPSPVTVSIVDKDLRLETFTLSTPVALRPSLKNSGSRLGSTNHASTYKINGTRLDKKEKSIQKRVIYNYAK
jgi:Carboxypeptidase regulatory-like domain